MIKRFAQLITIILILSFIYPMPVQADDASFSISGAIIVTDSSFGNAGITVTFGSYSATTADDGSYSITGIPEGQSEPLTPSSDCDLTFVPGSGTVTGSTTLDSNLTGQDFTASGGCTISGRVTTSSGAGLAGVSISGFATTDNNGNYAVTGVPYYVAGWYTPSLTDYTFTPPISEHLGPLTADLTGVDFVANTYPISGAVTAGGTGLSGVVVTLNTFKSDSTGSDGKYTILDVPTGINGDLTPSEDGYTFSPPITINGLTGPLTDQDFTATINTYDISGTVTSGSSGLSDVTVSLGTYSATTDGDGNYTIKNVDYGTSGDLTATKDGYTFSAPITITSLTKSLTGQDFTATINTYDISGTVTSGSSGLSGVKVSLGTYSATTDGDGNYTIKNVDYGTSGDLTPSKDGYTFSSPITITSLTKSLTGQDFTATINTYDVSGTVTSGSSGLSGVKVSLGTYSATTDGDGNYTIKNVDYGTSGSLDPELTGYGFTPGSLTVSPLTGPLTHQDFTATQNNYDISGKVIVGSSGLAGATVAIDGHNTLTISDGTYIIPDVPSGTSGDLTATKDGYTFSSPITITSLTKPLTDQNFTATLNTYNISGTVTFGSGGLAGVSVSLGTYSAVTDGSGNYTIHDVDYGTSGALTPSLTGYGFTPGSRPLNTLTGPLNGQDFTAYKIYNITGTITIGNTPTGLAGVIVALGPFSSLPTGNDGKYTINSIPAGTTGKLTASKIGYTFKPTSIAIPALAFNLSGKNFVATQKEIVISGKVSVNGKALKGVKIHTISVGLTIPDVYTNLYGDYSIKGLPGGNDFYIGPALPGYTFSPDGAEFDSLASNKTQDFSATLHTESISGTVSGLGKNVSIQIRFGNGKNQIVPTDGVTGEYTITGLPANMSYTLTPLSPTAPKYRFTPLYLTVAAGAGIPTADKVTSQDFVASEQSVLSGTVTVQGKGIPGVTITANNFSTMTDSHGKYSLWVPKQTAMTPIASHAYFNFLDGKPILDTNEDDTLNQDWKTATVVMNGQINGLMASDTADVVISARPAGTTAPTINIDTNGNYQLTVHDSDTTNLFSFTVTPVLHGYNFSPNSRPVNTGVGDKKNFNFTANPTKWSVSGVVDVGSTGLSGVEVDATINSVLYKAFTNNKGAYTFNGVPYHAVVSLTAKKYGYSVSTTDVYPITIKYANVSGLIFTAVPLQPMDGSISGTITLKDTSGSTSPLRLVLVTLLYKEDPVFTTLTGTDGKYTFSKLYHGTTLTSTDYEVVPARTNYIFDPDPGSGPIYVDLTGGSSATQDFAATRVANLKGKIYGLPAGTNSIDFSISGAETASPKVSLDKYGNYVIKNLPASVSPYIVKPEYTGYNFKQTTFTISMTTSVVIRNFTASH